jgi:PAS domain S-box-containing protein
MAVAIAASAATAFARSRHKQMRTLRDSENRFRTLAETASDAIITIDEHSRIVLVNQAAEKVFGYTRQEMIGAELTMLMPESLRHRHHAGFGRYMRTGERNMSWEAIELPGLHKRP